MIGALLTYCCSKGYATLDYEDAGWQQSSLVKLQLLVNRAPVDAICKVVHSSQVDRLGKQWVTKFKEHVDRQHFGKPVPTHTSSIQETYEHCANVYLQRLLSRPQRVTAL